MKKENILYISQYGDPFWARTVRELREKVGGGKITKMYVDKKDGGTVHCGYVIGNLWLSAFMPLEKPA